MGTTTETRISSTQAKDAIYKAHSIASSASEIDGSVSLAHPSLNHFLNKINKKNDNVSVFINGDSTGDATNEWVYLLCEYFANKYPEYTVRYRKWNNTTNVYESPITVNTGMLSFYIDVWNGSTGSMPVTYLLAPSKIENAIKNITDPSIYSNVSSTIDLTIINHSHNHEGYQIEDSLRLWFGLFTESFLMYHSYSSFIIIRQNPFRDNDTNLNRIEKATQWANIKGFAVADVWGAFQSLNKASTLYADNVHPSVGIGTDLLPTGTRLFLKAVTNELDKKKSFNSQYSTSIFNQSSKALNVNWQLAHTNTSAAPDGYVAFGGTASKDTTVYFSATKPYSTKLTSNGGVAGGMSLDISDAQSLSWMKGKYITVSALMYSPDSTVATKGKIQYKLSTSSFIGENMLINLTGGWFWNVATIKMDTLTTYLKIYLSISTSSSVVAGESLYLDRVVLVEGILPYGIGV